MAARFIAPGRPRGHAIYRAPRALPIQSATNPKSHGEAPPPQPSSRRGAFGSLFAFLVPKRARVPTVLALGLVYGLAIHLVMVYAILRPLDLVRTTARIDTWWFLSEHLVYGLTVRFPRTRSRRPAWGSCRLARVVG